LRRAERLDRVMNSLTDFEYTQEKSCYKTKRLVTVKSYVCTLWGGLTANKVTPSPAAVATRLIRDQLVTA